MDSLRLLEDLKTKIEDTPSFGKLSWKFDKEDLTMCITKIRASIPQEMKAAASTVRESERILEHAREDATGILENSRKEADNILAEARQDAERIIAEARLQQERMVADSEILKLSKAQSEEVRNAAERDAVQMRRGSEKYAYDVLTQLENVVRKVATTIDMGKQEVTRQEAASAAADRTREKLR